MACLFNSTVTLTQSVINGLKDAKIDIVIQVDCSHAHHFITWPQNAPGQTIIAKPIELDTALSFAAGGSPGYARTTLRNNPIGGPLHRLSEEIDAVNASGYQGFQFITHQNLKIGFANFDPHLVDLTHSALAPIVAVCNAANPAAFNGQPANLRKVMGMYRRTGGGAVAIGYVAPATDAQPRVA